MRIFITGNLGYVGPAVVQRLRMAIPSAYIHGYDDAYFAHCLTNNAVLPERVIDRQSYGDVRRIDPDLLSGYDAVVHLAAVSRLQDCTADGECPLGFECVGVTNADCPVCDVITNACVVARPRPLGW